MANNTLNTRLVICNDTTANWGTSEKVLLKGEYAIEFPESGEPKVKIGNGTDKFSDLPYLTNTPTEITNAINAAINAASHSHSNKAILDAITASFCSFAVSNVHLLLYIHKICFVIVITLFSMLLYYITNKLFT